MYVWVHIELTKLFWVKSKEIKIKQRKVNFLKFSFTNNSIWIRMTEAAAAAAVSA